MVIVMSNQTLNLVIEVLRFGKIVGEGGYIYCRLQVYVAGCGRWVDGRASNKELILGKKWLIIIIIRGI